MPKWWNMVDTPDLGSGALCVGVRVAPSATGRALLAFRDRVGVRLRPRSDQAGKSTGGSYYLPGQPVASPVLEERRHGPVVQRLALRTFDPAIVGSSPTGVTRRKRWQSKL